MSINPNARKLVLDHEFYRANKEYIARHRDEWDVLVIQNDKGAVEFVLYADGAFDWDEEYEEDQNDSSNLTEPPTPT